MNKLVATGKLLILSGSLLSVHAQDEAGKVNFEKDVYPFLKNSCVDCHKAPYLKEGRTRPTKPKADLRFDSSFGIVAGETLDRSWSPANPTRAQCSSAHFWTRITMISCLPKGTC